MPIERSLLIISDELSNLGDLALLLQNLELAEREGRKSYIRRWRPIHPEIEVQVNAAGGILLNGRKLGRLLTIAARSDIVIGGGQMVRNNVSIAALSCLLLACAATRLTGGRILTRGLGVSVIREPKRRLLWRLVFKLSERLLVRDEASAINARALVSRRKILLSADMAFLPGKLHQSLDVEFSSNCDILVAPCVDRSEARSIDGPYFSDFLAAVQAALPQSRLHFVCHDPRPEMDDAATRAIIAKYQLSLASKTAEYRLSSITNAYNAAAIVITNRLHSVIFALLNNKPIILIDDGNFKTRAVAHRFSIPCVSVDSPSDFGSVVQIAIDFDRASRKDILSAVEVDARLNLDAYL